MNYEVAAVLSIIPIGLSGVGIDWLLDYYIVYHVLSSLSSGCVYSSLFYHSSNSHTLSLYICTRIYIYIYMCRSKSSNTYEKMY